jgi:hypothetical protein
VDAISDRRANGGELVLDLINVSPYSLEGEPLLFPFLFLEAKSGLSSDDWHSIKLQTCFPIRTALEIQRGLQAANGTSTKWEARPLVWFLMSKGEDWRLCSAFTTEDAGGNQSDNKMPCVSRTPSLLGSLSSSFG